MQCIHSLSSPTSLSSLFMLSLPSRAIDKTVNGMYTNVGQACGTCWMLTKGTTSVKVIVIDRSEYCRCRDCINKSATVRLTTKNTRCAGDCKADSTGTCDPTGQENEAECGTCITSNHPSVPVCSCYSSNATSYNGMCNDVSGLICKLQTYAILSLPSFLSSSIFLSNSSSSSHFLPILDTSPPILGDWCANNDHPHFDLDQVGVVRVM